jgi:hypothetical protein
VLVALGALGVLSDCTAARPTAAPHWPVQCMAGDGPAPLTLRVALPMPADAFAPLSARGAVERVAFSHVYETLVRIDCEGRTIPALAQAWSESERGRIWTFRLRADARFADGTPVSAADVVDSWRHAAAARAGAAADIEWVAASGPRVVRVALRRPAASPARFAARDLVIARAGAHASPPLGTGPYALSVTGPPLVLERTAPPNESAPQRIELHASHDADPRDAVDAGFDVILSASEKVLAYARELPDYAVAPLPWSRTYVLGTAAGVAEPRPTLPDSAQASIAEYVGSEGARPAALPAWWQIDACRSVPSPSAAAPAAGAPASRVIFPRHDATARAIAERIVALAWPAARSPEWLAALLPVDFGAEGAPLAVGLDDGAFVEALVSGRYLAVVAVFPRGLGELHPESAISCPDAPAGDALTNALLAAPLRLTALVDARDHVLHRRGSGRFLISGDAGILFDVSRP